MFVPAIALAAALIPVHGTVLAVEPHHEAIVRNDAVPRMLPSQTQRYRIAPALHLTPGIGIDGLLDSARPGVWTDAAIAGRFTPGLPDRGKAEPIDVGVPLPQSRLVDQSGQPVDLAKTFAGKVTLISFIFTRCPDKDECPAVTSKFAYLTRHLDLTHFHLVEITLDPPYDSPAVLSQYAKQFDANGAAWSMVTGEPAQIQRLLDRFGISSLRVSDANYVHSDKVFIADQKGRVADVVQTVGFNPDSIAAEATHVAGLGGSALGRMELSLVASVVALCGGSQYAGVVLLETLLFVLIAALAFVLLGWLARQLWKGA